VAPGNLSIAALGLMPGWAAVVFLLVALMVLGSSVDSYLTAIASLTSRDIYYRHLNPEASDDEQLRVARGASIGFAAVIFAGTVFALGSISFVQLLLIGGIGASALVGPFALSLFWKKTSQVGFVAGVVGSQAVTAFLLLASYDILVTSPTIKLWEIMAVGHLLSTGLATGVSLLSPDDFDFDSIAQETPQAMADGSGGDSE